MCYFPWQLFESGHTHTQTAVSYPSRIRGGTRSTRSCFPHMQTHAQFWTTKIRNYAILCLDSRTHIHTHIHAYTLTVEHAARGEAEQRKTLHDRAEQPADDDNNNTNTAEHTQRRYTNEWQHTYGYERSGGKYTVRRLETKRGD